jgi:hypothetical protein
VIRNTTASLRAKELSQRQQPRNSEQSAVLDGVSDDLENFVGASMGDVLVRPEVHSMLTIQIRP